MSGAVGAGETIRISLIGGTFTFGIAAAVERRQQQHKTLGRE